MVVGWVAFEPICLGIFEIFPRYKFHEPHINSSEKTNKNSKLGDRELIHSSIAKLIRRGISGCPDGTKNKAKSQKK